MFSSPSSTYDCFTDEIHPFLVHPWLNLDLKPLLNLRPTRLSSSSSNTSQSTANLSTSPTSNQSALPLNPTLPSWPIFSSRKIATRTRLVSTNLESSLILLLPLPIWQYHLFPKITPFLYWTLIEFNALIKNNVSNLVSQLVMLISFVVCGFSYIKRNIMVVLSITKCAL